MVPSMSVPAFAPFVSPSAAPVLGVTTVTAVAAIGVLVLAGLLLLHQLTSRRMGAFASELRKLQRDVHELKEDLRKVYAARTAVVSKEPAPPPTAPPPAASVPDVVVDLSPVERALEELRAEVVALASREPPPAPAAPPPEPAAPGPPRVTLRERIEVRFRRQGFDALSILGAVDLDVEAIEGEPVRVSLEGRRRGATYKGYVVLEGDRIVDEKMTSSHEAFP